MAVLGHLAHLGLVDGDALVAQFPCRPDRRIREVPVAGVRVRMEMVACSAEGMTFAASQVPWLVVTWNRPSSSA